MHAHSHHSLFTELEVSRECACIAVEYVDSWLATTTHEEAFNTPEIYLLVQTTVVLEFNKHLIQVNSVVSFIKVFIDGF